MLLQYNDDFVVFYLYRLSQQLLLKYHLSDLREAETLTKREMQYHIWHLDHPKFQKLLRVTLNEKENFLRGSSNLDL